MKDIPRPNEKLGHPLRARTEPRGKEEFARKRVLTAGSRTDAIARLLVISFMIAAVPGVGSSRQLLWAGIMQTSPYPFPEGKCYVIPLAR